MTIGNKKFKKGDTVCYTTSARRGLLEGTVTSVGHKYIYLDDRHKFHAQSLREVTNGNGAPGKIYASEEEFYHLKKLNTELRENINKIKDKINHYHPSLTLEQTRKILEIMYPDSKEQ